jgi:hypothetical protein
MHQAGLFLVRCSLGFLGGLGLASYVEIYLVVLVKKKQFFIKEYGTGTDT